MARKKKEEEVVDAVEEVETEEEVQEEIQDESLNEPEEEVVEAPTEKTVVAKKPDGNPAYTKAQFQELIESYKVQNPKKYEIKKESLQAQLKALK